MTSCSAASRTISRSAVSSFTLHMVHYLKKVFLFLVLLTLTQMTYGQQIDFKGIVTDSTTAPVSFVNIVAYEDGTASPLFTLTNNDGEFSLKLKANTHYGISLLHIGYVKQEFSLQTTQAAITRDFVLTERVTELGEVEVIYEMPIMISNDSIVYNVDSFATGSERKLKEVLRKLPGVEVDKEGRVFVMGERVTEVLVENKTFFNGSSKLAIENIPADAVQKIEVLNNHNKVDFLKGLEDNDKLSLNIRLKEDKKRFLFGDLDTQGGHRNRYRLHPSLFYYSPELTFNFIGDVNNIGEKSLSLEDFISFQSSNQILTNTKGFVQSINDLNDYFFEQDLQRYTEQFGAISVQRTVSPKTDVNAFVLGSNSQSNSRSLTENDYLNESETVLSEEREEIGRSDNAFLLGRINIDHVANDKSHLNLNTSLRLLNAEGTSEINSSSLLNQSQLQINPSVESRSLKQALKYDNKLSKKHTLSVSGLFNYTYRTPETMWSSTSQAFAIEQLLTADVYNVNQEVLEEKYHTSALVKDYLVINKLNHIYLSAGVNGGWENYTTQASQIQADGQEFNLNQFGFENDIRNSLVDIYADLEYKFKKGKFILKPGFEVHNYLWKVQNIEKVDKDVFAILPKFDSEIQFTKTKKLEFDYAMDLSFPETNQLVDGRVLRSFNSILTGNPNLEEFETHRLSLTYNKFNLIRGSLFSLRASYNYSNSAIQNANLLDGINSIIVPRLINKEQSQFNIGIEIKKKAGKYIKYGYKGDYGLSGYYQMINEELIRNDALTFQNEFSVETQFQKGFNLLGSYTRTNNTYESNVDTKFLRQDFGLNVEYNLGDRFFVLLDQQFTQYTDRTNGTNSQFSIADLIFRYQKEEMPWTFELKFDNIWDAQFKRENALNTFIISDRTIFLQPRMVLIKVSYKL